jgi:lipoprotein-anchoring transpeptidase ErfK/SrfK
MSSHRRDVRPRYGRIAVLATSVTVTAVAALAGAGVLATSQSSAGALGKPASYTATTQGPATVPEPSTPSSSAPAKAKSDAGRADPRAADRSGNSTVTDGTAATAATAVPSDSGTGRRVVFSQHLQRVWLVGAQADDVQRSYLVSGSVTHNLVPGTYSVYSKSRWAVGVDDSGVMQYFVRFTQGPTGAAIGFHTIPTKNDVPLQTQAQLGTPESHGCIRQSTPDAIALWDFAPIGTKVVVVA